MITTTDFFLDKTCQTLVEYCDLTNGKMNDFTTQTDPNGKTKYSLKIFFQIWCTYVFY